jgi:hypothetical protein
MKYNRHLLRPAIIGLIFSVVLPVSSEAAVAYMRSTVGSPWSTTTNETAMNTVFGIGVWDDLRYETANANSVFTAANSFIYMEGGDSNADELEAFLTVNLSLIQTWVSNGGSLFLNAAPNEGDGMYFGFGVTCNYPALSNTGVAVTPAHAIFQGPYGATGSSFSGTSFSHATVSGALTPLITGTAGTILGEADYGYGHVLFGGMTTTNFQSPQPAATALRENIIAYGASQAMSVPEPATATLGLLGILPLLRRRRC